MSYSRTCFRPSSKLIRSSRLYPENKMNDYHKVKVETKKKVHFKKLHIMFFSLQPFAEEISFLSFAKMSSMHISVPKRNVNSFLNEGYLKGNTEADEKG